MDEKSEEPIEVAIATITKARNTTLKTITKLDGNHVLRPLAELVDEMNDALESLEAKRDQ